jgi:hypothetical protein
MKYKSSDWKHPCDPQTVVINEGRTVKTRIVSGNPYKHRYGEYDFESRPDRDYKHRR